MKGKLKMSKTDKRVKDQQVMEALNIVFDECANKPEKEILKLYANRSEFFLYTIGGICRARDELGYKTKESCIQLLCSL